jgi:hypothetical protein
LLSEWTQMRSPCFRLFLMSVLVLCPPTRLFHYVWIWGCSNSRATDIRLWDYVRLENIAFLLLFCSFGDFGEVEAGFDSMVVSAMAMKMGPVWLVESCCAEAAIFVLPNWLQLELGMQKFYLSFHRFLLAVFFNLVSRASQMPHSSVQSSPLCDLEVFTSYVWARLEILEIWVTFHEK